MDQLTVMGTTGAVGTIASDFTPNPEHVEACRRLCVQRDAADVFPALGIEL